MAEETKKTEGTPESVDTQKTEAASEAPKAPTVEELQAEIARLKAENGQIDKLKKSNSEACSDAAEWKRKYRATLDEAERQKQEQAEELENLKAENARFKAEKRETTYFAKLVEAGFTPEAAKGMASTLPEGIPDTFFESQKQFLETQKQLAKTEALNSQPSLSAGMPLSGSKATVETEEDKMRKWMGLPPKK